MSKQLADQTQSTIAESMLFDSNLQQYNFTMKVSQRLCQVQFEIATDSFLHQALEIALDYFEQLNYQEKINQAIDAYEIFIADQQGNQLSTKVQTNQLLENIKCQHFFLVPKTKKVLLNILKQPMNRQHIPTTMIESSVFK